MFIATLRFDENARIRYESSIDWNTQTATIPLLTQESDSE